MLKEECADKNILQLEKVCWRNLLSLVSTWQLIPDQCHLQHQKETKIWHRAPYGHRLDQAFHLNITIHQEKHLLTSQDMNCVWRQHPLCPTCGTQGNKSLDMFANKCQLILGQRQPPHNVLDEVVWRHCCQVPLQLPQHHQFPFLERETERE